MSKTKQRQRTEVEHFRGQIRKLETENRQLKKRLRALDKRAHLFDDLIDAVAEDITPDEKPKLCKKCKTGELSLKDFKHIQLLVCDNCKDRSKV